MATNTQPIACKLLRDRRADRSGVAQLSIYSPSPGPSSTPSFTTVRARSLFDRRGIGENVRGTSRGRWPRACGDRHEPAGRLADVSTSALIFSRWLSHVIRSGMAEYGEWNRKGTVLSDVTAHREYGVTRDFIVKGIQAGIGCSAIVRR